jgi:hypothetical protein
MKDRPIINLFPTQEQKISDLVAINATIVGMGGSNESVPLKAISKSGREFMVKATVSQIFQFNVFSLQIRKLEGIRFTLFKLKKKTQLN